MRRALLLIAAAAVALTAGSSAVAAPIPSFSHVVVVVFENHEVDQVLGARSAPTFTRMARRYAVLGNYTGVAHPSLPNYLAMVSGSTQGITNDCTTCSVSGPNLAGSLEAAGRTWKTYAEGLPAPGADVASAGRYAKKHDPLIYFRDVAGSAARRRRIVPYPQLARDLAAGHLPSFSLVVPDLCHDMHDCSVATGDAWLARFLQPLLRSPQMRRAVVFVTFDEGESSAGGGGRVAALALGDAVRPGSRAPGRLDHYSLLRTIEDAWRLPRLGRSATAAPITGIWRSAAG